MASSLAVHASSTTTASSLTRASALHWLCEVCGDMLDGMMEEILFSLSASALVSTLVEELMVGGEERRRAQRAEALTTVECAVECATHPSSKGHSEGMRKGFSRGGSVFRVLSR